MGKENNLLVLVSIVFAILFLLHIFFQQAAYKDTILPLTSDFSLTLFSGLVALFGYLNMKSFEKNTLQRKAWLWVVVGFSLWFLGYLIWDYYPYILNAETPFPSAADYVWALGYFFLIPGFYFFIKYFWKPLKMSTVLVAFLFLILINTILMFNYYIDTLKSGADFTSMFLSLWYPFGDTVLLTLAIMISYMFLFKELRTGWLMIGIGLAVEALADITWTFYEIQGIYYVGSIPDILYLISNATITLGFLMQKSFSLK